MNKLYITKPSKSWISIYGDNLIGVKVYIKGASENFKNSEICEIEDNRIKFKSTLYDNKKIWGNEYTMISIDNESYKLLKLPDFIKCQVNIKLNDIFKIKEHK